MSSSVVDLVAGRLTRPVLVLSADIAVGIGTTLVVIVGVLATTGPLRTLLALPLVLFLPGYAVVSVLYPESHGGPNPATPSGGGRAALATGISVALLPLLGFVLAVTGVGFDPTVTVGTLGTITVGGLLAAGRRRLHCPAATRFHVPADRYLDEFHGWLFQQDELTDAVVNAALFVAVCLAVSTLAYGLVVPAEQASYSSFSVLTQEPSGELVAADYPTEFVQGQPEELVLAVENHRGQSERYTVVAEVQRLDGDATTIVERSQLSRRSRTVQPGATWYPHLSLESPLLGSNLRLAFFLYTDDAPAEPTVASANEHLFLWINSTTRSAAATPVGGSTPTTGTPTVTPTPNGTNVTATPPSNVTATATPTPSLVGPIGGGVDDDDDDDDSGGGGGGSGDGGNGDGGNGDGGGDGSASTPTPTPTDSETPTPTPTETGTPTATSTPAGNPTTTPTQEPDPTPTPTPTATSTPADTPTPEPDPTPTSTPTATPEPNPTPTPTPDATPTPTSAPTQTTTPTPTPSESTTTATTDQGILPLSPDAPVPEPDPDPDLPPPLRTLIEHPLFKFLWRILAMPTSPASTLVP